MTVSSPRRQAAIASASMLVERRDALVGEGPQREQVDPGARVHERLRATGPADEPDARHQPEHENREDRQQRDTDPEVSANWVTASCWLWPASSSAPPAPLAPSNGARMPATDERNAPERLPHLGHRLAEARAGILHLHAEDGEGLDELIDGNAEPHPGRDERRSRPRRRRSGGFCAAA